MPDNQPIGIPRRPRRQSESPPRRQVPPADPCAMVVFGAGGDMAKRLLIPALYNLSRTKVLPEKFALIGVDLAEGTAESWRDHLYDMLKTFVGNASRGVRHRSDRRGGVEAARGENVLRPGRSDQARALREDP